MRLERIYRGEQKWDELAALYEQRIEAGATKEERVQAYCALAELQNKKLGKRERGGRALQEGARARSGERGARCRRSSSGTPPRRTGRR